MTREKTVRKRYAPEGGQRPVTKGMLRVAYDLGVNSLMLRYNVRYQARFPWDRRAEKGQGIHNNLMWILEDVAGLSSEVYTSTPVRRIPAIVVELERLVTERLTTDGQAEVDRYGPGGEEGLMRAWGRLSALLTTALRNWPSLYPWYRLGRAVGHCFLDLFNENRRAPLPSFERVKKAVIRSVDRRGSEAAG